MKKAFLIGCGILAFLGAIGVAIFIYWWHSGSKTIDKTLNDLKEKEIHANFKGPFHHSNYLQSSEITTSYDKFRNTTVNTFVSRLGSPLGEDRATDSLEVGFMIVNVGDTPKPPFEIVLRMISKSKDWEYLSLHDLTCLIDERRVDFGEMGHNGTVGSGYVLEQMNIDIDVKTLLSFANAKKVECKLGVNEFKFTDEQFEATRDLISRVQQP